MKNSTTYFSLVLAAILFFPWIVRLSITEPYPAILFPSGHGKVIIANDSISFDKFELYGIKNGAKEPMDWEQFLGPIKPQYYSMVWMKELGFSSDWIQEDGEDTRIMPWKKRAEGDVENLKAWYTSQMEERCDSILFEKLKIAIPVEGGEGVARDVWSKRYKTK